MKYISIITVFFFYAATLFAQTPQGEAPTAAFTVDTLIVCAGDCVTFTDISAGEPTSWFWDFDGGNPETSNKQFPGKVCFDEPGSYNVTLTVSNEHGTDQIVNAVEVRELPTINGYGDTLIALGGEAILWADSDDFGVIFWTPENDLSCVTCDITDASPYISTTYYPSILGANGCIGRDTVLVAVEFEEIVEVPTAFTPEGPSNNLLRVLGVGITAIDFKIYNRYGQLVFSTTDIDEGWDGTLNGKPLNQGVFVWTLEYSLINGIKGSKTGDVTLFK